MKKFLLLFFLLIANQNFAQLNTHTFEEAEKLSKISPKPFVIFLHTDWCNYCKMMENTTFKDQKIREELNKNFYFISFNAEDRKAINFNNHAFKFIPKGNNSGVHELAISLGEKDGNLVYPTIAILDSDYSILAQIQSFTNSKIVLEILQKLKR